MIEKGKVTYSQSGEDILVDFLLDTIQVKSRRYLDIGANDPIELNNTYLFYSKGHRGVLIEPDPDLCKDIKRARPDDKIIQKGVGPVSGKLPFYLMTPHTLNTFSEKEANTYQKFYPWTALRKTINVKTLPINNVLGKYFSKGIDFLNIDTEGLDQQIIESMDFDKFRPLVICIETAVYKNKNTLKKNRKIIQFLRDKNYFVYADTFVNCIFVDYDAWLFNKGPNLEGY